jgi:hypothetical protein
MEINHGPASASQTRVSEVKPGSYFSPQGEALQLRLPFEDLPLAVGWLECGYQWADLDSQVRAYCSGFFGSGHQRIEISVDTLKSMGVEDDER